MIHTLPCGTDVLAGEIAHLASVYAGGDLRRLDEAEQIIDRVLASIEERTDGEVP